MKKFFSKNINRAIVFLCILVALMAACNHHYAFTDKEKTDRVLDEFYALQKDSADCLFFGSSLTQRAFVAPVGFHDHGVSAYVLGSSSQPFVLIRYLIEETLKTQTPKVFVIELKGACRPPDEIDDVDIRKCIDNMPMSLTKLKAIRAVCRVASYGENDVDKTGETYVFPYFKYHYLWNPSKRPHLYDDIDYYNGYSPNAGLTFHIRMINTSELNESSIPIDEHVEEALIDLLDYCDTLENSKVLFVIHPIECTDEMLGKLNYAKSIVEGRGYECLNFLNEEKRAEVGLNDLTDYYNREHLNYYGALKYTAYLSEYLKENYGVPDRRGDKACAVWEEEYERLSDDLDGKYLEKYTKMMKKIKARETEGN